jgi:hypothetical protein
VIVDDSYDFETELQVHGPVVPNTIASVLFHIRGVTDLIPLLYPLDRGQPGH